MALAGLYYGIITPDFKMLSTGYFQLPNQPRKYHDWMKGGHGWVGIEESIAQSVNTFYYSLAQKLVSTVYIVFLPILILEKQQTSNSTERIVACYPQENGRKKPKE